MQEWYTCVHLFNSHPPGSSEREEVEAGEGSLTGARSPFLGFWSCSLPAELSPSHAQPDSCRQSHWAQQSPGAQEEAPTHQLPASGQGGSSLPEALCLRIYLNPITPGVGCASAGRELLTLSSNRP